MRNKILRRIVIVMAIAMFLVTAAIVGSFVLVSLKDTEHTVKEFSEPIVDQVTRLDNISRLSLFVANKHGSSIKMTIFNSDGDAIEDTHDKAKLKQTNLNYDSYIQSILNDKEDATRSKYDTIYDGSYVMFTYYVKVPVNDKVDKNEFVVVRFAETAVVGTTPFLIFVLALVAFWILVVIVIAVLFNLNIKASMEPLTTVQNIINDISEGKYKKTTVNKYLVASEADKMVEEIDKMGAVINDTMHNLNVLLSTITQGVIALDKDGEIIFANEKAAEFLDVNIDKGPTKEFESKYAYEYAKFKESLKTGVPVVFENEVKGRFLHVETIFPKQEENMEMYMLLVITDMTEQAKTAKAKQEFFANASHELKTPLTAIAGYSEILTMGKPTEKQLEKCSTEIQTNAVRMKSLIDEMLQLSKMDAQTADIEKEEGSLRNLCDGIVEELSVIAQKKNIKITVEGDAVIHGNIKEIIMLIKNLVSNAIKYNKEKGYVKVSIKEDSKAVMLSVKDNGIGISKENQEKIFDRFYRVDEGRSSNTTGESSTGLGLSIVKEVVEDHNGTIKLNSELGKGSEFIITFPKE